VLVLHHGGDFVEWNHNAYDGTQTVLECDPDYWSYFSLLATIKRLGYTMISSLWYHDPTLLQDLVRLRSDGGCRRMQYIAEDHNRVHLYIIHSADVPFAYLNPLDEANDFPIPNLGVVLEEIVDDAGNVGGAVNLPMLEYPIGNVGMGEAGQNEGNDVAVFENEGNGFDVENDGDVANEGELDGGDISVGNEENNVMAVGPTEVNKTNDEGPTELGGLLNNVINVEGEASGKGTQIEGAQTVVEEGEFVGAYWVGEEGREDDGEDSALEHNFNDSEEELGDEVWDGVVGSTVAELGGDILEGEGNIGAEEAIQEDDEAVQNEGEATQEATSQVTQIEPTVTVEASGSIPKNKRGRPRGKKVQTPVTEPVFEDEVLADQINTNQNVGQASIVRDRGLSDEEEYNSDVLESGPDSEDEEENGGSKLKFATFKKPENMRDYEWEVGTYFVSKKEFQDAVRTFAVHSGRDVKFDKNDKRRVKVICRGNEGKCDSQLYCAKIPGEETWQLRRIKGKHSCTREYKLRIMNSDWLGDKLHSRVKENPSLKLKSIINRAHEKWNLGVGWSKAYRARAKAIDLVDGSFREQYTRIYDYAHELLRSNKESVVCVTTNPF